jgi:hypothetical protein
MRLAADDRAPLPVKKARLVPLMRSLGFAIFCEDPYQLLQSLLAPHSAADYCKNSGCVLRRSYTSSPGTLGFP